MTRAETCIPRILKHEGGYVNHPNDPGGPTNKGITLATFRRYIKPKGTIADLKALTTAQAVVVYKRQYWDKVSGDLLPVGLDYAVADFAVNSGPARSAKYLQAVLGVAQDGKIGPQTIAAARAADTEQTINVLCDRRMAFLKRLKTWGSFGKGWTRRVSDVRSDALSDAGKAFQPVRPDVEPISHPDPAEQPKPELSPIIAIAGAVIAALAAFLGMK